MPMLGASSIPVSNQALRLSRRETAAESEREGAGEPSMRIFLLINRWLCAERQKWLLPVNRASSRVRTGTKTFRSRRPLSAVLDSGCARTVWPFDPGGEPNEIG